MDNLSLGIIGGGQLARMIALSATHLGVKVIYLSPTLKDPASVCSKHILGSYKPGDSFDYFAHSVNNVTIETEHVSIDSLKYLVKFGTNVNPDPWTIELIQDKYVQKTYFQSIGIPLGRFIEIPNEKDTTTAAKTFKYPLMLKKKKSSYDGKGNYVCKSEKDFNEGIIVLGDSDLYIEDFVNFDKEISIIAVRKSSNIITYPVTETVHEDNICYVTETPADISIEQNIEAVRIATKVVNNLKGNGVFGIEMFLNDKECFLNEVAPRPHNSGHYTQNACVASQFENHVRAVLNVPLGSVSMVCKSCIMLNILGEYDGEEGFEKARIIMNIALETPGATVHWYGKDVCYKNRKLGHINICGDSREEVRNKLFKIDQRAWKLLNKQIQPLVEIKDKPLVGIIMGSDSDLETMRKAAEILEDIFEISVEVTIVSAHRTPDRMMTYAQTAYERGLRVIIAGAGGAAHLPGMIASMTQLPVIGVPVTPKHSHFDGLDALLSIVQMPAGVPVATVGVGNATNAGLLAARIIAINSTDVYKKLLDYQAKNQASVCEKAEIMVKGWRV